MSGDALRAPEGAEAARAALRSAALADPAALLEDAEVVRALLAAHPGEGTAGRKIVDLRGALLERLETRLATLEETHRTVVAAAWENLAGAQSIHRAALAVLEPTSFSGVLTALKLEVPAILRVEALRLGLETGDAEGEAEAPLVALAPGEVAALLAPGREADGPARTVSLRPIGPDSARLFGAETAALGSEALVRLDFGPRARPGLLAFGAADPGRFSPDQAGDLLEFFGGVLARAVRRWIAAAG